MPLASLAILSQWAENQCITLNLVVTEKISIIEKVHQYQCITILTVLEVVEESKLEMKFATDGVE